MTTPGERIRALISKAGILQKDLAKYLDVKSATVNCYLSGKRNPDVETIRRIADYFGVTVDYLIGYCDENYTPENVLENRKIKHLDDKLNSFVSDPLSKDYIEFAAGLKEGGVDLKKFKEFFSELSDINERYSTLVEKLEKKEV